MKRRIHSVAVLIIAGVLGAGCDRQTDTSKKDSPPGRSIESPDPFAAVEEEGPKDQKIPATLDEALDLMMTGLTDEDRKFIEDAGDAYATSVHFGSGMGMRNSWGLWGDSSLSRYFARLGIYHADDKSAIINEAFARRVRGKDIELEKLVQYYRDYWEKLDIIAPLVVDCPACGKEMDIIYLGSGVSDEHPDRVYFLGRCSEHSYLYYHTDGWRPEDAVWSGPKSKGDQGGRGDGEKPSN